MYFAHNHQIYAQNSLSVKINSVLFGIILLLALEIIRRAKYWNEVTYLWSNRLRVSAMCNLILWLFQVCTTKYNVVYTKKDIKKVRMQQGLIRLGTTARNSDTIINCTQLLIHAGYISSSHVNIPRRKEVPECEAS